MSRNIGKKCRTRTLKKKVLEILDAIGALVKTDLVEDCHHVPSKGSPKKVILKLSHRKDSRRVPPNKKKLKQLKTESLNLSAVAKSYINASLHPCLILG